MRLPLVVLIVALLLGAGAQAAEVPARFENGRVIALLHDPRLPGRTLRWWVDTDGSGFILDSSPAAKLQPLVLDPPLRAPTLPTLAAREVAGNAIFEGLDGQLGWSWLTGRIWSFDYRERRLALLATPPAHRANEEVALRLQGERYPTFDASIEDKPFVAALDTAATVVLSQDALRVLSDGASAVRATSFAPRATISRWHADHPAWRFLASAGVEKNVDMIQVPLVRAGTVSFSNVWFTSRPDDDVFQGDRVDLKIGPTAFAAYSVTVDYAHRQAIFVR